MPKIDEKKLKEEEVKPTYEARGTEEKIKKHIKERVEQMKEHREQIGIEDKWLEAENEYIPAKIEFDKNQKRFEQNQETGLRSRMVRVGGDAQDWRSMNSAPTLLVKIQIALSIIVDRNPEAVLSTLDEKYEKTTDLAMSLWKRNFEITNAKEVYKKFLFNLFLYGWGVGRTYPRLEKYNKRVLIETDPENPENDVYEEQEIVHYNDVYRENIKPFNVWIDEQTKPYEPDTMNECYYEIDYVYDKAKAEFGKYPNFKYVKKDSKVRNKREEKQEKERKDIVTVGFYENRLKDLYVIYIPKDGIVLYYSPLPNDDGMLSLFHAPLLLRSADSPYGITLWEIIKQDKELYDKLNNMTMDQLVLSVMKMGFYTGTGTLEGDGNIYIKPGVLKQITNGKIEWMQIPEPGGEAWEGLQYLTGKIDDASGITPTLEGEVTGKTLGEVLHAKESALKRLKTPIENISEAMEQDAYITLSWMAQLYSTPEVKSFSNIQEMLEYEKENEIKNNGNIYADVNQETGEFEEVEAEYYRKMALHLEDRDGSLIESKESQYFQIGKDIEPKKLKWKGIFRIIPKTLIPPSQELEKQIKGEIFNMLTPLFADPEGYSKYGKGVEQILKVNDEDPEDWMPDSWLEQKKGSNNLFVRAPQPGQEAVPGTTMKGQQGLGGQTGQTVVPQNETTGPGINKAKEMFKGLFKR